ncbi:hypothetical protein [Mesonia aestuariivivens]|uniref:Anti-sigma factor n=1 Tax=Mesonia aestuariivivens TaxID=2796128 RepID=A0ABS6VYE6_9FLAO|nr:hypothetical protein [Mesonia aestuariivivens]MBW2960607.1 hypothetical protein [Mesonia aestuariivivens]
MELSNINILLNKYFEAETTLAEEKELEAYFLSGNVAPELEEYIPLFSFLEKERTIKASSGIEFEMPFKKERHTRYTSKYKWLSVAASVAVICSVFWFTQQNKNYANKTEPVSSEIAMQNTQDLLLMMTEAVATSKEQLNYLNQLNKTKDKLIKKQ